MTALHANVPEATTLLAGWDKCTTSDLKGEREREREWWWVCFFPQYATDRSIKYIYYFWVCIFTASCFLTISNAKVFLSISVLKRWSCSDVPIAGTLLGLLVSEMLISLVSAFLTLSLGTSLHKRDGFETSFIK